MQAFAASSRRTGQRWKRSACRSSRRYRRVCIDRSKQHPGVFLSEVLLQRERTAAREASELQRRGSDANCSAAKQRELIQPPFDPQIALVGSDHIDVAGSLPLPKARLHQRMLQMLFVAEKPQDHRAGNAVDSS